MLETPSRSQVLEFTGIDQQDRGIITALLQKSYVSFYSQLPGVWETEKREFDEFDQLAFDNPTTVGRCVTFSSFSEHVVGLVSFDPRQGPERGIVGHNCILPEFRGKGFGKLQIREVLREFKSRGFHNAVVSTGDNPFFLPAQRMYLACGFKEVRRGIDPPGAPESTIKMIEYEREVGQQ